MMEQDVGASGRIRRCEIADHTVEAEQRLHEIALEIAVEDLARAARDEVVDDADVGRRKPEHVLAERGRRQPMRTRSHFRRRAQDPLLEHRHDLLEIGDVAVIARTIGLVQAHDLLAGQPIAAADIRRRREEMSRFRSTTFKPCRSSSMSRMTFGLSRLTV